MNSELLHLARIMPKAELHLHIEGSLEPEMVFKLARRNQIKLTYATVEELKAAYSFNNLQEFLDVYYAGMSVLLTEDDFYDLTWAYLKKVHDEGVVHVEIFFDPQAHLERGVPLGIQLAGIQGALEAGKATLGISYRLILSFLRHLSEASALETLELARHHLDRLDGFGLDSSETGHPPEKFARVFAECKKLGKPITVHAGEEGPPEYVWQALDLLKVDRIDHGNRAMEDEELVERLVKEGKTLTVCPLSNLSLAVVEDLQKHPLVEMLNKGLKVTLNSDDPAYFGGYLLANYQAVIENLPLTRDHLHQLARNAFEGAWISEAEKQKHLADVDAVFS
ncbi:adenosine deaminase [Marinospirillum sp.]|uniref:adenosine deaminase n=1 Tax=Marinospirillum sp. TaxID=2183934 RepID=UPI00384BA8A7